MAFGGLRKWLEEASAQVNPFDGGRTAQTVRATRQPKQPSGTDGAIRSIHKQIKSGGLDRSVGAAKIRALSLGDSVFDNTASQTLQPQGFFEAAGQKVVNNAFNPKIAPITLGIGRSATGTGEGLSGLYDLATPGTGTNRFGKGLTSYGKTLDDTVKGNDFNKWAYKGAQLGTDVATFSLGGMPLAKGAAKAGSVASKVPGSIRISQGLDKLADTNKVANVGVRSARFLARPDVASDIAVDTALSSGLRSNRGGDISTKSVATDAALSAGFGLGVGVAGKGVKAGVKVARKELADNNLISPFIGKPDELEAVKRVVAERSGWGRVTKENDHLIAREALRRNGVDMNDTTAVDDLLGKQRTYQTRVDQRKQKLQDIENKVVKPVYADGAIVDSPEVYDKANLTLDEAKDFMSSMINKYEGKRTGGDSIESLMTKAERQQMDRLNRMAGIATQPTRLAPEVPKTTVRVLPDMDEEKALVQSQATPPVIPNPPVGVTDPNLLTTGKQKKTRFADKTIPASEYVSDPIKETTKENAPLYSPEGERAGAIDAATRLKEQGDEVFETNVRASLDKPDGTISRQEAIDAQLYAQKLEEKLDDLNMSRASEIYDRLSAHYTKAGQLIQAAAMMSRRSPAGMKNYALRKLQKAGVEITAQVQKELDAATARLAKTDLDTDARAQALDDIMHTIAKHTPTEKADLLINFWRANLLTAPTTTGGGFIGNIDNLITRKLFVNPVATMTDMVTSLFTGKRTVTIAPLGSFTKGAKEGIDNATSSRYWKTGYDAMENLTDVGKYDNPRDLNYGNSGAGKAVGTWVNGVYRVMGAVDQPYRYGAKAEVLASMAKAEAINKGLKGKQRTQYIEEFMANPPAEAVNRAIKEGRFAVFQDETALGHVGSFISNGFKRKGWHNAAALTDFIIPFAKIPGSVATRLIKRTPIGIGQEIVKQVVKVRSGNEFDQRAMSQALAEGMAGAPIVAAGYAMAEAGLITGGYPSDDKERKLWQAEGKQPNSVKVGDRWYSLNYIQPFGALLNIGAGANLAKKEGKNPDEIIIAGLAEGGKSLSDMSFLQGVSGAIDAVKNPGYASERFVANTASSLVPNFVRSFAGASDPFERQASGPLQGLQSGIPGLRQGLPVKTDAFGQPVPTKDNFLNRYVNPLKPSKARNNAVVAETRRLKDAELGTMPSESNRNAFGSTNPLSKQELKDLNGFTANRVTTAWEGLINSAEYKQLSDEDKKKSLDAAKKDYSALAKAEWASKHNKISDEWEPKLTAKQKALGMGNTPDYIYHGLPKNLNVSAKKVLTEAEDKDETWKSAENKDTQIKQMIHSWLPKGVTAPPVTNAVAKRWGEYEKKKAEGTLGKLEDESERKSILRDAYNSQLSEDEKDLYSLSENKLIDAYKRGLINDANIENALKVEKQLYDAGLISQEALARKLDLNARGYKSGKGGKGRSKKGGVDLPSVSFGNAAPKAMLRISEINAPKVGGLKMSKPNIKVAKARTFKTRK